MFLSIIQLLLHCLAYNSPAHRHFCNSLPFYQCHNSYVLPHSCHCHCHPEHLCCCSACLTLPHSLMPHPDYQDWAPGCPFCWTHMLCMYCVSGFQYPKHVLCTNQTWVPWVVPVFVVTHPFPVAPFLSHSLVAHNPSLLPLCLFFFSRTLLSWVVLRMTYVSYVQPRFVWLTCLLLAVRSDFLYALVCPGLYAQCLYIWAWTILVYPACSILSTTPFYS